MKIELSRDRPMLQLGAMMIGDTFFMDGVQNVCLRLHPTGPFDPHAMGISQIPCVELGVSRVMALYPTTPVFPVATKLVSDRSEAP